MSFWQTVLWLQKSRVFALVSRKSAVFKRKVWSECEMTTATGAFLCSHASLERFKEKTTFGFHKAAPNYQHWGPYTRRTLIYHTSQAATRSPVFVYWRVLSSIWSSHRHQNKRFPVRVEEQNGANKENKRFLVVDWNVWGVHVLDAYVAHLPLTGTLFTHVTFTWEESLGNMTYQCPQWWALEQFNKGCRVGMLVLVICFVYSLAYCLELLHESLFK